MRRPLFCLPLLFRRRWGAVLLCREARLGDAAAEPISPEIVDQIEQRGDAQLMG